MSTRIETTRYKDREAIALTTSALRAVVIPSVGSNMASLQWLATGQELMRQRSGSAYRTTPYGGAFGDGERAGFDDMFPTIDFCHGHRAPWLGVALPDHGEVWTLPWDPRVEKDALHLQVHGVRFPYRLEKTLRFTSERTLRIDYVAENLSPFELPYLWAAHPDLALPADAVLTLPPGVTGLVTAYSPEGSYGEHYDWPVHQGRDLRKIQVGGAKRAIKYYVRGRMPEGWCRLAFPKLGTQLTMRFPVESVPYFAFLPNEGVFENDHEIFLEPCTASFDRPDVAALHHEESVLPPRGVARWYLELEVGAVA